MRDSLRLAYYKYKSRWVESRKLRSKYFERMLINIFI